MKYCLPLMHSTTYEVEANILAFSAEYTYFEIWIEYIEDVSIEWLLRLSERWEDRLIFLFRRQQLEAPTLPRYRREVWLEEIAQTRSYVDFDITTQKEDLEHWLTLEPDASRVLLSFHDYAQTPDDDELYTLLQSMQSYQPWICKIAAFCQSREDALRLLALCEWFPDRFPGSLYIFLGMGEHGLATRIMGSLWGNAMTFAPIELETASAPGQLTYEQYDALYAVIAGE